jgi:uncharacterized protein YutE (UPF0331/DUF86 family)
MVAMTGFRNIAVHVYQTMNLDVLRKIDNEGWKVLVVFLQEIENGHLGLMWRRIDRGGILNPIMNRGNLKL